MGSVRENSGRNNNKSAPLFLRMGCASAAGSIAECLTLPFDAVSTRLQLQPRKAKLGNSVFSVLKQIVRNEHIIVLWRGLTPALARQAVLQGFGIGFYPLLRAKIQLTSREQTSTLNMDSSTPTLWQRVIAGSVTGGLAQLLASPFDVVKVRMQSQAKAFAEGYKVQEFTSLRNGVVTILRKEGIRGLYIGIAPSIFRASCQFGTGLATYDFSKHYLLLKGYEDSAPVHVACSVLSGFCTAVVGNPADVLKTRMIGHLSGGSGPKYTGPMDCLQKTLKNEGFRALYKGFIPNYCRLAPWQIVFFICFEKISLFVTGHTFSTK
uniref:Uncharacterized protein n=1 Tax=Aplanochytrium stocchinoi TaxID=215587 RepID=A0A7S3LT05_9STRA